MGSWLPYPVMSSGSSCVSDVLSTTKKVRQIIRLNKLLLYKSIIKHIWMYGIEILGCASKASQAILQKAQSSILRMMTDAPWYVTNLTLHDDLKIPFIRDVISDRYAKHHWKLVTHPNPTLQQLLDANQPRRLKRTRPSNLL